MKLPTTTTALLATLLASTAAAAAVRTVYQFADTATWIENVAVRSNGNLLLTTLSPAAALYEVDLDSGILSSGTAEARLIHRFDAYEGALGIAETSPDVFAVAAGNYTSGTPSWSLWAADFTALLGDNATVTELVPAVPDAGLLNGLTTLDDDDGALLVSDSVAGRVLRVDGVSGGGGGTPDVGVFLADAATMAPPNASQPVGVNGVHYRSADGYLYYTNTYRELFCRVPADGADAAAVEVLAEGDFEGDDFALREEDGSVVAYIADGVAQEVVRFVVGGSGEGETVVSGVAPTSAVFGRGLTDSDVLYVVTRDGKVLAVDVDGS